MSPAVRRALAYVAATGRIPTHLHLDTWTAVRAAVSDAGRDPCDYVVRAEHLDAVKRDPLAVACEWFRSRGFRPGRLGRSTSHYVAWHRDGFTGLAYRSGGGTLYIEHGSAALPCYQGDGAPYRTSYALADVDSVWPCILRPGMYAGERGEGEHGRDYLIRALDGFKGVGPCPAR